MSRAALSCAWPAMALAAALLLPYLNSPFTIDDPLYLREAQHSLVDPLHPQAFDMVWSTDQKLPLSQILPGGIAVPYLLIPAALTGCAEWAGHLTQLVILLAALYATALAALRLGLDQTKAGMAALLTATCPAVLGMSATVMPDVAAMLFTTLGMERLLAWKDDRRWSQSIAATAWLTLAALTRTHTLLVLAAAFVLLLDGIMRDEIRASLTSFPWRFLPLLSVPVAFAIVSRLTADPNSTSENILASVVQSRSLHVLAQNTCAFLAHFTLVIPLTIPWLILRFLEIPRWLLLITLAGASLLSLRMGWVAFVAGASFLALADILRDAIGRRDRVQLALWLWLLPAIPAIFYIHLPAKYLLPSVPAVAVLLLRRETSRFLIASVAAAGILLGLLIVFGSRDLGEAQRRAVVELISPHTRDYERVWFSGHWGFQWYAEAAGAWPVTLQPPFPQPGDIIVVSQIDLPRFPQTWSRRKVLQHVTYPNGIGRVMDIQAGAGFFSSVFGYLPWVPGTGDANSFEVWRVERPD